MLLGVQDLTELKSRRGNVDVGVIAVILGMTYPSSEAVSFFDWDNTSTVTPDDIDIIKPTVGDQTIGRWIRIDPFQFDQIQSNWTEAGSTNTAFIKNKPSLSTVATSGSYIDLTNKPTIPGLLTVSAPTTRTLSLATAYQATDNTKAAIVTVNLNSTASLTLSGGTTVVGEIRIGSANTVASGTGSAIGAYKNSLTGTLAIGLNIQTDSYNSLSFALPTGWYFAIRQTSGSGLVVVSAFDQSIS